MLRSFHTSLDHGILTFKNHVLNCEFLIHRTNDGCKKGEQNYHSNESNINRVFSSTFSILYLHFMSVY